MSKKQIIKEQQVAIQSLEADYAEIIRQRDSATRELDRIDGHKRLLDRAKREAATQEKVDGIKAGLIPVEDLRKHIRDTFEVRINQDRSAHDFKLFFKQGETDRISLAIRDAILAEHAPKRSFAEGGYVNRDLLGKINSGDFGDAVTFTHPPFEAGDKVNAARVNEGYIVSRAV
jgi:hypothetical protein